MGLTPFFELFSQAAQITHDSEAAYFSSIAHKQAFIHLLIIVLNSQSIVITIRQNNDQSQLAITKSSQQQ
jgi:hypothetical protein